MFFVPTFIYNAGSSAGSRTITFIDDVEEDDWGSVNIGAADVTRRIFLAGHTGGGVAPSFDFTVNGNAATTHVQTGHFGGASGVHVGLGSILVPTGTTCSIDCDSGSIIGVWVTYGMVRTTPYDTATDTNEGVASNLSTSINVPDNGFVLAAATNSANASGSSFAWSGVTERYDRTFSGERVTGANSSILSAQTGRSIQANTSGGADAGNELAVLSWN